MANNNQKDLLSTLKALIIAGYAVSLFVPYKVEKHDGETTYHAPLYKLAYKSYNIETTEKAEDGEGEPKTKKQTVHTYTVTSFGLLNDQIATAKRLYKVALLKKPSVEAKVKVAAKNASDKAKNTAKCVAGKAKVGAKAAKAGAAKTAGTIKHKVKGITNPTIFIDNVTEGFEEIIEAILD